jgi:GR25 family glycosyltransferase involved in LPS biosynthesis
MQYRGFYLNLERDADRRRRLEVQLAHYRLRELYSRFPAADGNILGFPNPHLAAGEIGCFTSHYLVLKQNADAGLPLHVVEDDVVFSEFAEEVVTYAVSHLLDDYDIVFTDTAFDLADTKIVQLRHARDLFESHLRRDDAGKITSVGLTTIPHTAGSSSYIVNPRSIPKLLMIYERLLAGGNRSPFDLVLKQLADERGIRTTCLFPFVTSVQIDADTTIGDRQHDPLAIVASNLVRAAFFVGADLEELRALSRDRLPGPETDPYRELFARSLVYFLSRDPR